MQQSLQVLKKSGSFLSYDISQRVCPQKVAFNSEDAKSMIKTPELAKHTSVDKKFFEKFRQTIRKVINKNNFRIDIQQSLFISIQGIWKGYPDSKYLPKKKTDSNKIEPL